MRRMYQSAGLPLTLFLLISVISAGAEGPETAELTITVTE